jgi:hypothetical protein
VPLNCFLDILEVAAPADVQHTNSSFWYLSNKISETQSPRIEVKRSWSPPVIYISAAFKRVKLHLQLLAFINIETSIFVASK